MNFLLVVMLAGLWFWLLSPGVLRDRRPRSPIASVDSFEHFMDTLGPLTDPRANTVDLKAGALAAYHQRSRRSAALRRRQMLFRSLLGAVVTTLVIALFTGGWTWWLPAVAATLLLGYILLLIRIRSQAELHRRVRRLPDREDAPPEQGRTQAEPHRRRALEG